MRVLIVEDHALLRQSMAFVLEHEPDFEGVTQAECLASARDDLNGIDVAIVDLTTATGRSDVFFELSAVSLRTKVLALCPGSNPCLFVAAIEAGAAGVLSNSSSTYDVITAVRQLQGGHSPMSPSEMSEVLRLASKQRGEDRVAREMLRRLTPRERDVLQALGEGLSDKEIALRLTVSCGTTRDYVSSILRKLGVESRLQAVLLAVKHGVLRIEAYS